MIIHNKVKHLTLNNIHITPTRTMLPGGLIMLGCNFVNMLKPICKNEQRITGN